jgi:type I restriction enzyme S subunit
MTRYRIKDVARINARTLPEDTSADFSFRYIDISSVDNLGNVNIPVEEISFDDAPSRARRVAPPGAVAVSTVRTYLKAIAPVPSSEFQLVFSTGFAMLEGRAGVDQRYLAYHCRSQQFVDEIVARSTGVSYPAINASEIGNLPIDLPGIEQQRRIADFLDGETARADLFAGKRAAQKAALEELEFSLIAETLSGGENRGGSGRPTGMSWLPWIPSDWKIGPVYGYFSTELGKMLNPERAAGGSQRPYLRNANVH